MSVRLYWLSLRDVSAPRERESFLSRASLLVDTARREKAEKIQRPHARVVSLGAGLLLQKIGLDFLREGASFLGKEDPSRTEGKPTAVPWSKGESPYREEYYQGLELIMQLEKGKAIHGHPLELTYALGPMGKPTFKELCLHFNLSHSGEYVLCAVSDRELGVDLQKLRTLDERGLARRFFTSEECGALEACDDEESSGRLFFRLWTRKEAYGKLTGGGIGDALGRNFLSADPGQMDDPEVSWLKLTPPEGYEAALAIQRR